MFTTSSTRVWEFRGMNNVRNAMDSSKEMFPGTKKRISWLTNTKYPFRWNPMNKPYLTSGRHVSMRITTLKWKRFGISLLQSVIHSNIFRRILYIMEVFQWTISSMMKRRINCGSSLIGRSQRRLYCCNIHWKDWILLLILCWNTYHLRLVRT